MILPGMKTEGMSHQMTGFDHLGEHPDEYALACEQGTGKTWMILADAVRQALAKRIECLVVVAPKGVHSNWVRREAPKHIALPLRLATYSSGMGKRRTAAIEKLFRKDEIEPGEMVLFSINIDALNTKAGYAWCLRFLRRFKCMMVIDESQRIKNPSAARSKKAVLLGEEAVSRRIASGTMITQGPTDAFGQFQFLRNGILGTTSFRSFVAEYSELLPETHPLVKNIIENSPRKNIKPQIAKKDPISGMPIYRNLDKLKAKMDPYTYRVTKEDCLDLPPKVFTVRDFELTPAQRRLYDSIKKDMRHMRDDGEVDLYTALTIIGKLRQVTSGFLMEDGVPWLLEDNPRIDALMDEIEDCEGQGIIWCTYKEEARQIAKALKEKGLTYAVYNGDTKDAEREAAIDGFQAGKIDWFIGNPQAGGTGITLTNAENVIYFSCDYSLEQRLQSEDRAHRIGLRHVVRYVDLAAIDTIDEAIAAALQMKQEVAFQLLDAA